MADDEKRLGVLRYLAAAAASTLLVIAPINASAERLKSLEQISAGLDLASGWDLKYVLERCTALYIFSNQRLEHAKRPDAAKLAAQYEQASMYFLELTLALDKTLSKDITTEFTTNNITAIVNVYIDEASDSWAKTGSAISSIMKTDFAFCKRLGEGSEK